MKRYILRSDIQRNALITQLQLIDFKKHPLFEAVVDEYKPSRSKAQNALMHMWFTQISKDDFLARGRKYSPTTWKEYFKDEFLGEELIELPNGRKKLRTRRTRDLKVSEMATFLSEIDHYVGSELEIQLNHPEDLFYEAMGIKK